MKIGQPLRENHRGWPIDISETKSQKSKKRRPASVVMDAYGWFLPGKNPDRIDNLLNFCTGRYPCAQNPP
jgi:hypothetical protein